ncbi:MAG: DUF3598 family protein [Gloeomargarita sp. GMQP_bins_120]
MQPLPNYPPQWQCLLRNLGQWQGTFTDVSPVGKVLAEHPSVVTLEVLDEGSTIRQTIRVDGKERVLVYRTLGRGILLFADGAFSQGSLQWGPLGDFGAELGLIQGDRRVRCAMVYQDSVLQRLTLIQEQREPTAVVGETYPPVTQLYPDWRTPMALTGQLTVTWHAQAAHWQMVMGTETWTWSGECHPDGYYEGQGYRLLCLQPEVLVCLPPVIGRGQSFALGLVWGGQAMWRRYDARGAWIDLTQFRQVRFGSPGV